MFDFQVVHCSLHHWQPCWCGRDTLLLLLVTINTTVVITAGGKMKFRELRPVLVCDIYQHPLADLTLILNQK
jgi:hypothetical protein